jgi:hypothetical protein
MFQGGVRIFNANGTYQEEFEFRDGEPRPFPLTEAGVYNVVVIGLDDDPETGALGLGDYGFRILDVASQPLLPLNTEISGSLDPGAETDLFRFDGDVGQRLSFDNLTPNCSVESPGEWKLFGPGLSPGPFFPAIGRLGCDFEFILPVSGSYLLALEGTSDGGPVEYSFQVTALNP